ncbi:tape measure protein [Pseudomonas ovata]|uniref:tape measure protein n=1 Tax=Pseudomonas ovata TaxID=1839709 RepID=UPI000D69F707|nr:tape measure protein [Pseudomonas ovata]
MSQEVQGMLIRLEATTAQLRQEMARADSTVAQVSGRIDRQLATVDSAFARAGQSALSAGNMLRNAMGAVAAGMSISSLVAQADAYASIASRLRLVTSSAAEFTAAQKAVFTIAQEAYQPLTATAELYQRIATNQKELKLTGEGVAGVVGTISKTLAISGASASSANAALIQLGQAFASGVLRGEELNSVMEQAPALAQAIAAGMGKTVGQLRTLGADGKLTADAVVKALQSQQKAVEELYAKTAVTIGNSITAMGNSYTQLIGRIDQAGNASARVASVIVDVSKVIDTLTADSATTERTFARVSSVAETLAIIIGGRLALAAGQMVIGFAAATKASIQQAVNLATSTSATLKQAEADAVAAKQALITAKSRQTDAQAMLARASAEILAAEQKVAADRIRQTSEINNLKYVQATLAGERVLEEQRLAAQISEQGRAAARSRMAEARLAEVAIIRQIQEAEIQLAATTSAASVEIQAAYAARSAAAAGVAETTLAANAAIRASDAATAATSSASKAMLLTAAAGRGLMALLTGPVGLIAMTAAVAYSFFNVGSSADSATSSLIEHNATVEESISQYKALSAEQQRLQKITWAEQQIEALDAASSALDDYTYKIERAINLGPFKAEFRGMIDDVEAGRKTLNSVTAWIEENTKLTPAFGKELAVLASEFQKNTKAADDFGRKINGIDSASSKAAASTDQLKAAQAASGQTQASKDAWDKYIEQLTKTRDLLGANATAEAAYTAAKMGATPAQAAQAKIIAEQTDVLKKYQDAIKEGDKVKQASLKAELTALYTAEDAAKTAAAVQSKAYADTATAAENSSRRQITAMEQAANFAVASATRVAMGAQAPQLNLTGYGLLTNGGTAPVIAAPVQATPDQRAAAAIAQLDQTTEANKRVDKAANAAATALKNQKKALEELLAKSGISIQAANAMADAYLAGAENVRALTIQQSIEEELLKTGAGAREKVTKAINAQHDAQDRLEVAKTIADMRTEVEWLEKEAKATVRGTSAVEAFNVEKAVKAELAGKNIALGSKEYDQLVAMTKAQLEANKALEQANKANDIVDRLNPQIKLLKDYTEEQHALNRAMELYPEKAALYQDALVKLGNEYEVNRSKATLWGQMTEGAIDRIDQAFASAWSNIGDGASTLWDDLKKGFKQTLGEIMHMLTTKPLLASISNWLTGTDNGQGLGSVWSKILGSVGGSSGGVSIGGLGGGSLAGIGKSLYQAWSSLTGVGSSIAGGYATGGIGGAVSGGVGYYTSMLSSVGASITSGFSSLMATITGTTAAQTAAVVGAQGVTAASLSVGMEAAAAGYASQFGAITGTVSYAAAESAAAASAAASTSAMMGPLAILMGMYQSGKLYDAGVRYDTSDMQTSKLSQVGRALPGMVGFDRALTFASIGLADRMASSIFGGKMGAILSGSTLATAVETFIGEKLFGTKWATKDTGMALSVAGGEFNAEDFQYQKKKGGLFGSNKKRFVYGQMQDAEMAETLGAAYNSTVIGAMDLFAALNVTLNEAVLDGLNVERLNISTQDRTTEEIQADITAWFTGLGDSAVAAINSATAATLDGLTFDSLQTLVNNLYSVNASLDLMGVKAAAFSVTGARVVESLVNSAGDIDTLNANITSYYTAFTSETQQASDSIRGVRQQFAALGVQLPATEDAFRDMLKAIDVTTEAGRATFTAMTANAESAAQVYAILQQRQSDYYGAFHTESENTARAIADTTAEIKKLGITLPATRDAFRTMVEAAEKDSSAAGKAMLESLLSVAAAAGTVFDAMEATAQAAADAAAVAAEAAKAIADAQAEQLMSSATASFSAVQRAIAAEQKAATEAYNARTASFSDMLSTVTANISDLSSLSSSLEGALKSLTGTSDETVKQLRVQAQATLQSALTKARSGSSLAGFEGLDDALSTVSTNDTGLYASLEDFNREQGRTANVVAELNTLNGKQLSSAEKSVEALNKQIEAAKKAYDLQMSQFDSQLNSAQAQLDALNGIDNSVMSVAAAMQAMNSAIVAALSAKETGSAAQNNYDNHVALLEAVYQKVLGRSLDASGKATWTKALANGTVTYDNLVQTIATGGRLNGETVKIPGYASGGDFGGGLRLVGENGPELEITGPSRIYNANQTAAMLANNGDGQATAQEVRALRAELKAALFAIAKNTMKTANNTDLLPRKLEEDLFS